MRRFRSGGVLLVFLLALALLGGIADAGPVVGTSFTSSTLGTNSGFVPPDTMGAVGPSYIVELINGRYAVYDKSGSLSTSSSLDSFWTSAGVTPSGAFSFDPRILYDDASGRWFASSVDDGGKANSFLFAVSKSSDPADGWTGFKIDTDPTDTNWADFPTMGYDSGAVYLAANMFPLSSGSVQVDLIVLPKSDLTASTASVANMTAFYNRDVGSSAYHGYALQPIVDLDGGGTPTPILGDYNTPAGYIAASALSGTASSPTFGTGSLISIDAYSTAGPAAQKGSSTGIDTGDTRLSSNAILVDGNVWVVHTVDGGSGRAAIQWLRLNSSGTSVLESGLISDSSLEYYFPSIAVNEYGDVVIGFTASDSDTYASAYAVVGKLVSGTTSFGTPILLKAGTAAYVNVVDSENRWGDYSATVVDPSNPLAFWTFQEWASGTNVWSTQITKITVDGPTPVPEPGTLVLMGMGALLLGAGRYRRRRRR